MQSGLILSRDHFDDYLIQVRTDLSSVFAKLNTEVLSVDAFSFYTSVSSVYSSKIEGENIDLDSYLKHRFQNKRYLPDYTKKTDDLFSAYLYAKDNPLNLNNLLKAHRLLSKNQIGRAHV